MSRTRLNLIGQKFNQLTVIELDEDRTKEEKATYFLCICDCGRSEPFSVQGGNLTFGTVKRCNKCKRDLISKNSKNKTHGMKNTRIYNEWMGMKTRCKGYNHEFNLKNYTHRGIAVCDEWVDKDNGFLNFYNWAISNGYNDNLSIDRIDNDGNYEPNNCRWITMKEQFRNKQDTIKVTYNSKEYTLLDLLEKINRINDYNTIRNRLSRGWSIEESLTIPYNIKKHYYYFSQYLIKEFREKDTGYKMYKKDFVNKYINKDIRVASYMLNKYIQQVMQENKIKNKKAYFIKEEY